MTRMKTLQLANSKIEANTGNTFPSGKISVQSKEDRNCFVTRMSKVNEFFKIWIAFRLSNKNASTLPLGLLASKTPDGGFLEMPKLNMIIIPDS